MAGHAQNILNAQQHRQALESVGNTPFVKSALKKKALGSGFSQMEPPMFNEEPNSRDMLVQNQDLAIY